MLLAFKKDCFSYFQIPIGVVDPGSDETQIEAGREEEEGEGHERRTQGQGELVGGEGGCSDSSIESQSFSQEVRGLGTCQRYCRRNFMRHCLDSQQYPYIHSTDH